MFSAFPSYSFSWLTGFYYKKCPVESGHSFENKYWKQISENLQVILEFLARH